MGYLSECNSEHDQNFFTLKQTFWIIKSVICVQVICDFRYLKTTTAIDMLKVIFLNTGLLNVRFLFSVVDNVILRICVLYYWCTYSYFYLVSISWYQIHESKKKLPLSQETPNKFFWIWNHMPGDIYPKFQQSAEKWNIPRIPSVRVGKDLREHCYFLM